MHTTDVIMSDQAVCVWSRVGLVATLCVIALLASAQPALAWGATHRHITIAAYRMIPQWQQDAWKAEYPKLTTAYCMFPDRAGGTTPDIIQNVRPYLYYDRKGWLMHYFPAETYEANRLRAVCGFEWVVAHIISSIKAGEMDKAARYAGGFSHALQDASCPIHSLEGPDDLHAVINLVHAPPADDPYFNVWAAFWSGGVPEPATILTPGYKPRLLGTSPQEIAWHLYDGYRGILFHTRCQLIAAIDAIYSGMDRKSPEWKAIWDAMAPTPAKVIADLYYSCFCVANNRIDPADMEALQRVRIESTYPAEMPPGLAPPYDYVPVARDVALDKDGKPQPLALRIDGQTRTFEHGLSTGSAAVCCVGYHVPPQVFTRLSGWVGLHPDLAGGGKATIEISLDGKPLLQAGPIGPGHAAVKIDVPVLAGGRLDLISRDPTGTSVVVWADTVLERSTAAPVGAALPEGWEPGPFTPHPNRSSKPNDAAPGWSPPALERITAAALDCLAKTDGAQFAANPETMPGAKAATLLKPPTRLADYDATAKAFDHYVREIAQRIKDGRSQEAAQFADAAIAILAERASPVKCLDAAGGNAYRAFAQLFPPPPDAPFATAVAVLANGMDAVRPDFSAYRPRLLGASPAEAAFHARQAYVDMVQGSCYELADLVKARYAGDDAKAAAILNRIAAGPAKLAADLLHTAACIAADRYDPAELEPLQTVDLTRIAWLSKPGYAGGPYRTQPIVYGFSLQKEGRKKVPLKLRFVENGREHVRTFKRGLGVGGHAKWAFTLKIPPKVFGKLDICLGMHATLGNVASYGKKHGCMQLQIALDKAVLFDSGVLTPDVPATHAVVDVTPGGLLQLRMFDRSGQWANYGNQVVYGEPTLRRAAHAPQGIE